MFITSTACKNDTTNATDARKVGNTYRVYRRILY